MIDKLEAIDLESSPSRPRAIRATTTIKRLKQKLDRKKKASSKKLDKELQLPRTTVRRILKNDPGCHGYKVIIEPALTDQHIHQQKRICKMDSE
ncbi:unnamed protein product [Didymodactylos carnosus]|uniref:Uncharacterized protein n=2 Tax=Didymodactylos carnosus TaxID=1234261 RepID=A0A814ZD94_9BILA|nr:unnamed protein product [Didymodactylos carnosus]CAF4008116.1 unnamed protein product [Didymodactylos carnosus]